MKKITTTIILKAPKVLYILAIIEVIGQALAGSFLGMLTFGIIALLLSGYDD